MKVVANFPEFQSTRARHRRILKSARPARLAHIRKDIKPEQLNPVDAQHTKNTHNDLRLQEIAQQGLKDKLPIMNQPRLNEVSSQH